MKIASPSIILSALALCAFAAQGTAQTSPGPLAVGPSIRATVDFAIPQSADPSRLTYTRFGALYTNTDGQAPGDNQGTAITGRLLLAAAGGGGGVELHGRVGSPTRGGTTPVTEVDFYTTYTGALALTSTADPGFTPWQFGTLTPLPGFAQGFSYFKTNSSQADLDDFTGSFGLLTITPVDLNDQEFLNSSFGTAPAQHPQDVPEPGTLALLGGLCAGGGLLWRRRAKRTKWARKLGSEAVSDTGGSL